MGWEVSSQPSTSRKLPLFCDLISYCLLFFRARSSCLFGRLGPVGVWTIDTTQSRHSLEHKAGQISFSLSEVGRQPTKSNLRGTAQDFPKLGILILFLHSHILPILQDLAPVFLYEAILFYFIFYSKYCIVVVQAISNSLV